MTPQELRQQGQRIYPGDPHWIAKLARAIPIDRRNMRKMVAGTMPISARTESIIRILPVNAQPFEERVKGKSA